jgi:hypothetical protein
MKKIILNLKIKRRIKKMYCSLETFQKYSNVFSDNTELQESYINAAENIVESYLGYSLKKANYVAIINGTGNELLSLKVKPITKIISVSINGIEKNIDEFNTEEEFLIYSKDIFPEGIKNITVEFEAGYSVDTTINDLNELDGGNAEDIINETIRSNIPKIILLTILRIAALLQSESDSNIGITSKTFGDSGTRTFINYTNFDKYLIPLNHYKLLII